MKPLLRLIQFVTVALTLRRHTVPIVFLCGAWLSIAQAQTSYRLHIIQNDHATITVDPDLETYPARTEVTLTVTPHEGYRFMDWVIVRPRGGFESESERGRTVTENPHTFTVTGNLSIRTSIGGAITPNVYYDNLAVFGVSPGASYKHPFERDASYADRPIRVAQRFRAGEAGNVTAVEIGMSRIGSPGGKLIYSVREVDESTGHPGELVGTLGTLEVNTLAVIDYCALPMKSPPARVEGFVGGLEPGKDYFLHVTQDPDDLPNNATKATLCNSGSTVWIVDLLDFGGEGQVGEAERTLFDYPWPPDGVAPGWGPWDPDNLITMRFRIEGAPAYTLTIKQPENGTVTKSPDLPSYPAGTKVTLIATPNEGFAIAGWTAETVTGEPQVATAYDNLEHTTGDYLTPSGKDRKFAQQFLMNGATGLQQVELKLFRIGTVTGSMAVELWNDDGNNDPSEKIADLGTIDDVSTMPTTATTYTFTNAVDDLDPDEKYWIVPQFEGLTSTLGGLENNVAWRWSFSAEGSMGADHAHVLRAQDNGVWSRMTDVFGDPTLLFRMRVQTISAGAPEQLELPRENPLTFTIAADTTITPKFAEIPSSHTLTINQSEHGTVTKSPDLPSYPAGTEVTLTATPNEGYQFTKWVIGESEFTENPLTITIEADTTITPEFVEMPEELTLFDTSTVYGPNEIRPGFEMWAVDEVTAQPFFTGDSNSIVSVSLDVRILAGSPTGRIIIEVWDDDGNGKPKEKLGTLGSVTAEDLPLGPSRPVILTTVEGRVSGLKPQSHYYLIMNHEEVVFRSPVETDKLWYATCQAEPKASGARIALTHGEFTNNRWITVESETGGQANRRFLVMKITGVMSGTPSTHTLTITPSEGGAVTAAPDLPSYPAGTEVTLTATPNEGYVLAGWSGDTNEEGKPLSITLTMDGDKNVTATFSPVLVPKITGVAFDPIARSVSLTWPSHPDAVYEIEMSTDLVAWESLQTMPGTGEQTTAVLATPGDAPQLFFRLREKP